MKKLLLCLCLFLTLSMAFKLPIDSESQVKKLPRDNEFMKVRSNEYPWLLDIMRVIVDFVVVAVVSPLFFIPSFFFNNQEIYIVLLSRFMKFKYVRLSSYIAA